MRDVYFTSSHYVSFAIKPHIKYYKAICNGKFFHTQNLYKPPLPLGAVSEQILHCPEWQQGRPFYSFLKNNDRHRVFSSTKLSRLKGRLHVLYPFMYTMAIA